MKNVAQTENRRQGHEKYKSLDITSYNKKVFNMFHGVQTKVSMRFDNELIGVVIDKFGKDIVVIPDDNSSTFTITADIAVSKQFCAWVFGFTGRAKYCTQSKSETK